MTAGTVYVIGRPNCQLNDTQMKKYFQNVVKACFVCAGRWMRLRTKQDVASLEAGRGGGVTRFMCSVLWDSQSGTYYCSSLRCVCQARAITAVSRPKRCRRPNQGQWPFNSTARVDARRREMPSGVNQVPQAFSYCYCCCHHQRTQYSRSTSTDASYVIRWHERRKPGTRLGNLDELSSACLTSARRLWLNAKLCKGRKHK